jgi:lipoprotein-releasing system ATP-binding protein
MNERGATLLEIAGLEKHFSHRGKLIEVLKGIDLLVTQAEMCAVVGASGAGKSTFLHVVGTLDKPSAGNIKFRGEDVTSFAPRKLSDFRNKMIGFVFQFHHLLPEFTALENTMMPGLIQRLPRDEIEHESATILEEVGLSHRLTHKPGELSGGEQQRVALARALVLKPALLLADEPTGNLDAETSEGIHDLFFDMNQRYGTTMLLVTHNPSLAKRMPRTLKLEDGVVSDVENGEIGELRPSHDNGPGNR